MENAHQGITMQMSERKQTCVTVHCPKPRPAVALDVKGREAGSPSRAVAWLHLYTKSSLWRTSCVRILVFVCLIRRQLRSSSITLGGGGAAACFCCFPSKMLLVSCSLCSILSLASWRHHLLACYKPAHSLLWTRFCAQHTVPRYS